MRLSDEQILIEILISKSLLIIQYFSDYPINVNLNVMKYISVILFTFTTIFAVPSYGETMDELVYRENTYYAKFTDVPFSGEITGMFQGTIRDGKKEGLWREYHSNGQLSSKANYTNNVPEGASVSYTPRGDMLSKGNYKRGLKEGLWEELEENSIIYETVNFIDGLKEGKFVKYFGRSGGQIASKGNYKNGELDGEFVSYYQSGKMWSTGSYKNGCYTGLWSYRNINGELYSPLEFDRYGDEYKPKVPMFIPGQRLIKDPCDKYQVRYAE